MRKPDLVPAYLIRDAIKKVILPNMPEHHVEWDEMFKRFELCANDVYPRDVFASSATLEGLETAVKAKIRTVKNKGFKKTRVIVFDRHSDPDFS